MERTAKKIGLLHHVGGGNLGDDATLEVVTRNISQRWPDAVIAAFSMNPEDTARRHGIPAYPIRTYTWGLGYSPASTQAPPASRFGFLSRLSRATGKLAIRLPKALFRELAFSVASFRRLTSFDLLIISGGGQLTERGGPWGFLLTILKWVLLAKAARVRCVFLNVGAGPLTHPASKIFARRALRAADYVSFRDDQSQRLARDIGFTGESRVFPDMAYLLEVPASSMGSLEKRERPVVGLAPMPYPFCDPGPDPAENRIAYDDFIAKFACFAAWLDRNSYSSVPFGTDIGVDPLPIEDLQRVLSERYGVAALGYHPVHSVHQLISTMTELDYIITCRFHGVVLAHLLNKPVIAVSHHPKVANLMKDLGLPNYCVDIRSFYPNQLVDMFSSMVRDADKIKSRMSATLATYKSQLACQFDTMFPRSPGRSSAASNCEGDLLRAMQPGHRNA